MKPKTRLATARTPDGFEMHLYQHDRDFSITVDGYELMNSRQHESELELARLGCAALTRNAAPNVLIGGLGLGYTLRQALDMLGRNATVTVAELLGEVVEWNRTFLAELNGHPLKDERVHLRVGDVVEVVSQAEGQFDAILLDVDNGPHALADAGNQRLYSRDGICACRRALRNRGCLGVWSAEPNKGFEQLLVSCGFLVRRYRAPAYKGSKSQSRFIWLASEDKALLPPGGGEPRVPPPKTPRPTSRRLPGRR
jgi:spermidine synthase